MVRKVAGLTLGVLVGISSTLWAFDYSWKETKKGQKLVVTLSEDLCQNIASGDYILFFTESGKIYKRKLKKPPRNCAIGKTFKKKERIKVFYFHPSTLTVEELGEVE
jgi:hypothetical protein